MKNFIALLLFAAALAGSGCEKLSSTLKADSYQFVTTPSGDSFVFHPKSGKIARVTKDGLENLTETTKVLEVGNYYRLGDASGDQPFVKYLGSGKFEPAKFAITKPAAPVWTDSDQKRLDELKAKLGR